MGNLKQDEENAWRMEREDPFNCRNEVLIKSVAQAMPMYVMNIFLLPDTLIDEIHKALNLFWWGDGVKQNPIRWCSWERMCVSKFRGGMGFRHLGLFNRSLLAKQVWRLITSPTTLAGKLLKARYFPRSSFLDAKAGYRPSYIWRSFIAVKELVRKGCKWNIGNGRSVNVWEDFWLADHNRLGPKPDNSEVNYVRDLLNNEGDDWNYEHTDIDSQSETRCFNRTLIFLILYQNTNVQESCVSRHHHSPKTLHIMEHRVWISKGILSDMLDEQEGLGFGALSGNESGAFL
ncbi:hypothetical protein Tco_1101247 [Tanacetum coccineum]